MHSVRSKWCRHRTAMEHFKGLGMKGPVRPAPVVPAFAPNRYSPVTNWNDDPFSADLFEPTPSYQQKKIPPPRPPPPKLQPRTQPDVPTKPSHFTRKPTILSSLMSRKDRTQKTTASVQSAVHQKFSMEYQNEITAHKMFPRCETKVQTASLIDLSSPPSSPTFTTRSSSDGLSIDSFGSDATSSTNQQRAVTGSASQAESGFEDDFELFLSNRKPIRRDDTVDDFANFDPFSPVQTKPPILRKPTVSKGFSEQLLCNGKTVQQAVETHKLPTIIRAKPARPKPPENSALLKMSFTQQATSSSMNLNMSVPIQRVQNSLDGYNFDTPLAADEEWSSPEREDSPPMPTVPPPPPPVLDDSEPLPEVPAEWPEECPEDIVPARSPFVQEESIDTEEPYAIALYNYVGEHPDDLSFDANTKVKLLRRVDAEWLYGRVRGGAEGVFPANHVEVRVPLPGESRPPPVAAAAPAAAPAAVALYDFLPSHAGDLPLRAGDRVAVLDRIDDDWCYGECGGSRGQFPANYVQMC